MTPAVPEPLDGALVTPFSYLFAPDEESPAAAGRAA
jgi:hypothetical protein